MNVSHVGWHFPLNLQLMYIVGEEVSLACES